MAIRTLIIGGVGLLVTIGLGPLVNSATRFFYDCIRQRRLKDLFAIVGKYYLAITAGLGFALFIAVTLVYPDSGGVVLAMLAGFMFAGAGINRLGQGLFSVARKRSQSSLFLVIVSVLTIVVPLGAIFAFGETLIAIVGGLAVAQGIVALLVGAAVYAFFKKTQQDFAGSTDLSTGVDSYPVLTRKSLEAEIVRYGSPFFITYLFGWVMSFADRYLIRIFSDSTNVAVYAVGYTVASVPLLMITDVFSQLVQPILLQSLAAGKDVRRMLVRWIGLFLVLTIPMALVICILAPQLIGFLAGANYQAGSTVVPVVVVGHLFYTTAIMLEMVFYINKKTSILPWINGMAAAINLLGNMIAIPIGGIVAAGTVTAVTYGFQLASYVIISRRIWEKTL